MGSRPKEWANSNGDSLGPSSAAHAKMSERAIASALEDEKLRPVVAGKRPSKSAVATSLARLHVRLLCSL